MVCSDMQRRRKYELKRRAERQRETRRRIVEAAVDLHTTVGPARTTISAVAERADVQRHTVYAHFPDEQSLFRACSEHWAEANPFPDANAWAAAAPGARRLRAALRDVYAWYERVEDDLALFNRDSEAIPDIMRASEKQMRELRDFLARGWPRSATTRAAVGHALEFETWRSLVRRQRLSRRAAIDLVVRLADTAAAPARSR